MTDNVTNLDKQREGKFLLERESLIDSMVSEHLSEAFVSIDQAFSHDTDAETIADILESLWGKDIAQQWVTWKKDNESLKDRQITMGDFVEFMKNNGGKAQLGRFNLELIELDSEEDHNASNEG